MTTIRRHIALATALVAAHAALAGDLSLRRSVVLEPGRPVAIGDVAQLTGEDAVALAALRIADDAATWLDGAAWRELTLAELADALSAHDVNMGRLAMSGSACVVRLRADDPAAKPGDAPPDAAADQPITFSGADGPAIVRTEIMRELTARYGVEADHLRATFESRDAAFLDQPTGTRTVVIAPGTAGQASRLALDVKIIDGRTVIETRQVRVDAELWRRAVVMTGDVERGDLITTSHLAEREMWIEPTGRMPIATAAELIGQKARARLTAGQVIREGHVEAPVMIKRNDMIRVIVVSGGCRISLKARACSDGRLGDPIEIKMEKSRRSFVGTVDGPGSAIVMNE